MLLAEFHHGVILLEKGTIADCLVPELIHCSPFKASQTDLALAEYPGRIFPEQDDGCIGKVPGIIEKFEMIEPGKRIPERRGRLGNAALVDTTVQHLRQRLGGNHPGIERFAGGLLPTELLRIPNLDTLLKHLQWH